jgi:hypothetical protein
MVWKYPDFFPVVYTMASCSKWQPFIDDDDGLLFYAWIL